MNFSETASAISLNVCVSRNDTPERNVTPEKDVLRPKDSTVTSRSSPDMEGTKHSMLDMITSVFISKTNIINLHSKSNQSETAC
jgi:hypothetical protein